MKKPLLSFILLATYSTVTLATIYKLPMYNKTVQKKRWIVGVGANMISTTTGTNATAQILSGQIHSLNISSREVGFNVFAGQRLGTHFEYLLSFTKVGNVQLSEQSTADTDNPIINESVKASNWYVALNVLYNQTINQHLSFYGKLGLCYIDSSLSGSVTKQKDPKTSYPLSSQADKAALTYGAGIAFNIKSHTVALDYTKIDADDTGGLIPSTISINYSYAL